MREIGQTLVQYLKCLCSTGTRGTVPINHVSTAGTIIVDLGTREIGVIHMGRTPA